MDDDLAFAGALEQRRRIAARDVSPRELVELYCERIERLDGRLRSYLTVTRERRAARGTGRRGCGDARRPAGASARRPRCRSRTRKTPAVCGRRRARSSSATTCRARTRSPWRRILGAGAIVLGKTNCPEFGLIGDTTNRLGDPCRNPWNTDRSPGGSSGGGAAAVAAGLCALSQGSDGGGSIRGPASFCGVYGIKATLGRVARHAGPGVPTPVNHFSQHGPLARSVRDAALMLQVLAGRDARDPNALRTPTRRLRRGRGAWHRRAETRLEPRLRRLSRGLGSKGDRRPGGAGVRGSRRFRGALRHHPRHPGRDLLDAAVRQRLRRARRSVRGPCRPDDAVHAAQAGGRATGHRARNTYAHSGGWARSGPPFWTSSSASTCC